MIDLGGSSSALFAIVWSAMCLLSAALVTDTMLRDTPPVAREAEQPADPAGI